MSDRVTVSMEGGVADVRLTRPDKLNACDVAMFEALAETADGLAKEPGLRAVVLSGEGRGFSAGIDVSAFGSGAGGRNLFERGDASPANFVQHSAWAWRELPAPVVAGVHGVCFGAGLQIALAADVRFVAPDARLSVMEIKWGLVPDVSGTRTLIHLVRDDVARELVYTGREVSGTEAVALGLASHVSDDPHEAALELAREIATKSPSAIRADKKLLNAARLLDDAAGLLLEEGLQRSVMGKPNQLEAVQANLEKRPPNFRNPD
ncbi:MAG: crotonase/enoyl-CoA hydratase family protein [Myxococcota bacterium]